MIQMLLLDKLKHQVGQQLLSHEFHVAWRLHYTITVKHIDAATDAFIVLLPVKNCNMPHRYLLRLSGIL